jgi:hypothetical protein
MGGLDVPERLGRLLENPDPDVRLDATIGLGLTRLGAAATLLRGRGPREPLARVKTQIERQIRIIDDAIAQAKAARP